MPVLPEELKGLLPGRGPAGLGRGATGVGGPAAAAGCAAGRAAAGRSTGRSLDWAGPAGAGGAGGAAEAAGAGATGAEELGGAGTVREGAPSGPGSPGLGGLAGAAAFFAAVVRGTSVAAAPFPPATAGNVSLSRRTTGASTVEDAERTNSPISLSLAMMALLSMPSSFASS